MYLSETIHFEVKKNKVLGEVSFFQLQLIIRISSTHSIQAKTINILESVKWTFMQFSTTKFSLHKYFQNIYCYCLILLYHLSQLYFRLYLTSKRNMSQTGKQLKLKQKIKNCGTYLDKFKMNPQTSKLDQFQSDINQLIKSFDTLQFQLKKNKSLNQGDLDEKIRGYSKKKKDIVQMYYKLKQIAQEKDKSQLLKTGQKDTQGNPDDKTQDLKNRKLAMELRERVGGIAKQTGEVKEIITNGNTALEMQDGQIDDLDRNAEEIQTEMSIIDQFMRIINNRHLLTKLMLVLLILFIGIADFLILAIKIT